MKYVYYYEQDTGNHHERYTEKGQREVDKRENI